LEKPTQALFAVDRLVWCHPLQRQLSKTSEGQEKKRGKQIWGVR
jgi:hypothetical protein